MGDELDNEENPPAFSSILLDNIEFAIANGQNVAAESTGIFHDGRSAGADSMPFPYTPFRNAPFPWKHMHGTYQSYEHNVPETCSDLMIDLNQLHNLQNPLIDSNSINVDSNIPWMSGQDLQHHEWDLNGVSCALDETWTADNVMNDTAHFNSLRNPESNRNFPPINDNASYYPLLNDNAGRGYAMARQGGEAYISNTYEPQMKNFVGLGGIKTCNAQNSEGFSTENNDNICAAQSGCPKKFDGSFLSLGVGRNTHVEPKSDHGSREVNLRLDGAVSSQLYTSSVHQATRSSMNLGPNGTYSSFQNNVGGFRSVGNHAGGWTSSNNNVGLNSRQFHILQKPQAEMQHHFPPSSARNLGMLGDRDARYANLDACKGFIGELTRSSGPCSSSSTGLHDSGPIGGSGLASESVKLSRTTSQPTSDQLHRCLMETVQNFSPESSLRSSFMRFKGSSTRQEHSGQEFSVNNGTKPHVSAGGLVPKRIGVEDRKVSAAQAATSDLLAQRLGVQVNEHRAAQAAGHGMFAKSTGIQVTDGRVAYAAERGLFPKDIRVQMASKRVPNITLSGYVL